jgi:hypothetical protein
VSKDNFTHTPARLDFCSKLFINQYHKLNLSTFLQGFIPYKPKTYNQTPCLALLSPGGAKKESINAYDVNAKAPNP